MSDQVPKPHRHHIWRITRRTLSKSWDDSIFSESAQAAFWSALSLPPLLLGMLGSLAYVAPLFGPDTLPAIEKSALSTAHSFFSPSVVNEIIEPTIGDITNNARGEVASLGFLISLWAGSSQSRRSSMQWWKRTTRHRYATRSGNASLRSSSTW